MAFNQTFTRFVSLFVVSLFSSLAIAACGDGSTNGSTNRDPETLKLLYWQAPTILNPHLSNGSKDVEASRITLEPLASFDNNGSLVPILAAQIPTLENGGLAEDGKSVTWKLKPGLKWSDGEPVTAEDVVFTYEFVSNPDVAAISAGSYVEIDSVEALDDTTVKVNFKNPNPAWFLPFVGGEGTILPQHIYQDYNGANVREAPANLMPVGTGPYRVVEFKPGDIVVYEPNPEFREADSLAFQRVELKGGGDVTSAARAVLQTEDADFAYNLQVEAPLLKQLEAAGKGDVVANLGASMERILINFTDPNQATAEGDRSTTEFPHPFLNDLQVRQAIALAIDRDAIATQLYGDTGEATANALIAPPQYVSDNTDYEFNLRKAAKLLDEAGWKDTDGNGIRDKDGVEMRILFQTSVNPLRQKTQEIIKAALESLDMEVELKSIDPSIFFSSDPASNDTVEHFYADLQMFTREIDSPDPTNYFRGYTCAEIPSPANNWSGNNATRYCNSEYDALWQQVTTELDPDKREELFVQMNDMLVEDVVIIPLVHRADVIGVNGRITGIDLTAWDMRTWNIADWGYQATEE